MESQRRALSVRTAGSANTTLSIMRGGANTWAECRPNRIGIQPAGKIFLLTFPFIGHVHTRSSDHAALKSTQLLPQELIQGFFLPLLAEPQRLARLQIAHHRQKFLLLAHIDLIDSHIPQRRFPPARCPALEIAKHQWRARCWARVRTAQPLAERRRSRMLALPLPRNAC